MGETSRIMSLDMKQLWPILASHYYCVTKNMRQQQRNSDITNSWFKHGTESAQHEYDEFP